MKSSAGREAKCRAARAEKGGTPMRGPGQGTEALHRSFSRIRRGMLCGERRAPSPIVPPILAREPPCVRGGSVYSREIGSWDRFAVDVGRALTWPPMRAGPIPPAKALLYPIERLPPDRAATPRRMLQGDALASALGAPSRLAQPVAGSFRSPPDDQRDYRYRRPVQARGVGATGPPPAAGAAQLLQGRDGPLIAHMRTMTLFAAVTQPRSLVARPG
jgi:hypothetical protein